jgi:hypothetical protein
VLTPSAQEVGGSYRLVSCRERVRWRHQDSYKPDRRSSPCIERGTLAEIGDLPEKIVSLLETQQSRGEPELPVRTIDVWCDTTGKDLWRLQTKSKIGGFDD